MSADGSSSTWRERLASPLPWHVAGFAVLLALAIVLAVRLGMDWAAMNSNSGDVLAGKQIQLKALEIQTAPLRGLDQRVEKSRQQIDAFYKKRIPSDYSVISSRIGALAVSSGVRLSRVQYAQGKPGSALTEISMDAGITGNYPQIMHFVNSLESDQNYFVIRSMQLTGQQGGQVNLRIVASTWLLATEAAASGLPRTPNANTSPAHNAGKEGE